MESEQGPKLKQLENFLIDPESEESKNYISSLLAGKFARPEEAFVDEFLSSDFWKEMGYQGAERIPEGHAGVRGRVEHSLEVDEKKIAVECKQPYTIKHDEAIVNKLDGNDETELKEQIEPYLLSHEFIIYTNGFFWYFYSRESYRTWLINKKKKDNKLNSYFKRLTAEEIFNPESTFYIKNILERNNILETLSSLEHKSIRHVVTDEFYEDLRSWISYIDHCLSDTRAHTKARTTSLINKLIFVRTMESVGIIPNGFLSSVWNEKKGISKSTVKFIDNIDEELSEIYDTELFTSQYVEDIEGKTVLENNEPVFNPERRRNFAYSALPEEFFSALMREFNEANLNDTGKTKLLLKGKTYYIRSIYWWKFENISADILGKAYETYLARERKKLGIFYTPTQMTEYLTSKTINTIFDQKIENLKKQLDKKDWDIEQVKSSSNEIVDIKICDPTCGSGSFLIQSIRIVWKKYKELENLIHEKDAELSKGKETLDDFSNEKYGILKSLGDIFRIKDKQERLGTIILRHIYGNDKDIKAVDTAKLNIWLECIRLDPNSFRKDSLKGKRHVLPNLELNITMGDSFVGLDTDEMEKIVSTMRDTIKSIYKLREEYIKSFDRTTLATYAATMRDEIHAFSTPELINEFGAEKTKILQKVAPSTNWSIQHLAAFYDKDGNLKPESSRGFDVIIGNPPWEVLKPNIDEFCTPFYEKENSDKKFSKLDKDVKDEFLKKITKTDYIKKQWDDYQQEIELQVEYFGKSNFYKFQKMDSKKGFGEFNLYRLFLEKSYRLLKKNGICGVVVPSNLYSLENDQKLRELIFQQAKVLSIFAFDNKKKIFDIHPQWKLMTLVFQKSGKTDVFKAAFYLRDLEKLYDIENNCFNYPYDLASRTSPITMSLVECNNQTDVDIIEKLFQHPLLISDNKWHFSFAQGDFNSSKHRKIINTKGQGLMFYEGKMMHQFSNTLLEPRYWMEQKVAEDKLRSSAERNVKSKIKKIQKPKKGSKITLPKIQLHHQFYRLAWRHVSRSTDTRTMICTILPPNTLQTDSLYFFKPIYFDGHSYQKSLSTKETSYICGLLNTFVIDFILRHRVSMNISTFFVHETPIPRLKEGDHYFDEIVNLTGSLICTSKEYDQLKEELKIDSPITDPQLRDKAIAQINAYAAKVFSLSKNDLEYILNAFTSLEDEVKIQILKEFDKLN